MTIQALEAALPKLSGRDKEFAASLVAQFARKGSLSDKQLPWVDKLVARAEQGAPEAVQVGDMTGIKALFDRASKHLKFPAIVLHVAEIGQSVRINVAGERARFPGSLNVTTVDKGADDRRGWFGRIQRDGRYECSQAIEGTPEASAIAAQLVRFAANPAEVAAEHGRLTGHCCFCNLALTDERSTAVGYGKTCAKNFGLPWGKAH